MISALKYFLVLITGFYTTACFQQDASQANCRVNASVASNHQGLGACVVRLNDMLLVKKLDSGLYDLPNIKNISSIQNNNTSAQCNAHQSMWQQTGLNVEVEQVVGAQADGMWLFGCKLESGFDGTEAPFKAPAWSADNVETIMFVNPFDIDLHNWANKDHFEIVRDAYVLQGNYQKAER